MKCIPFFFVIASLLLQISVKSQNTWTLKKDKNGVKVFSKKSPNFKADEVKAESEFDGRISQLAAVILDVNHQNKWVYKTVKSQLLKQISPTELFYYTEIGCPWPFDNRDVVVHLMVSQNAENKELTITADNVEGYLPEKKNLVRVKYSRATWKIKPINKSKFKVEYSLQVDPGIGVPSWLLNLFMTNGPYDTFMNLKEKITLPPYANMKFPFITD
jgi:hypothetical protein